jgi:hypothetical protein
VLDLYIQGVAISQRDLFEEGRAIDNRGVCQLFKRTNCEAWQRGKICRDTVPVNDAIDHSQRMKKSADSIELVLFGPGKVFKTGDAENRDMKPRERQTGLESRVRESRCVLERVSRVKGG